MLLMLIIADVFADTALDCFLFGCNQRVKIRNKEDAIDVFMPYWKDKEQKMLEDIPDKLEGMIPEEDDEENMVIPVDPTDVVPYTVYECPNFKKAFRYLMQRLYELGYHGELFPELEKKKLIVDIYTTDSIAHTLKSRPELLDFFKVFVNLDADDKARIVAAVIDNDLLTSIRNSVGVTKA